MERDKRMSDVKGGGCGWGSKPRVGEEGRTWPSISPRSFVATNPAGPGRGLRESLSDSGRDRRPGRARVTRSGENECGAIAKEQPGSEGTWSNLPTLDDRSQQLGAVQGEGG